MKLFNVLFVEKNDGGALIIPIEAGNKKVAEDKGEIRLKDIVIDPKGWRLDSVEEIK